MKQKQSFLHEVWHFILLSLLISLFQTTALAVTTTEFSILHSFGKPDISPRGIAYDAAGNLYGIENPAVKGVFGSIFKIDTAGNLTTVYTFDGKNGIPQTLQVGADGNLYGVTGNTAPPAEINTNSVLYQLDLSGAQPVFKPLLKTQFVDVGGISESIRDFVIGQDGNVYLTTGNITNRILRLDPSAPTQLKVVFQSKSADDFVSVTGNKGKVLFGQNFNSPDRATDLFEIDPAVTGSYQVKASRSGGFGSLIFGKDGKYYGLLTRRKLINDRDFYDYSVVQYDTSTQPVSEKLIISSGTRPGIPGDWLAGKLGVFFIYDQRSIDKLDITGVTPSLTQVFTGSLSLNNPVAISGDGSLLSVLNIGGGLFNAGNISRIDVSGAEPVTSVLYSIKNPEASAPGRVIQTTDGKFYGIAAVGGKFGRGAFYRVDTSGPNPVYTEVFGFGENRAGLAIPQDFVQAKDGKFYGITSSGGSQNTGGVFRLDISGQSPVYTELLSLDATNRPFAQLGRLLFLGNDGNLYGLGGSNGERLFKIDLSGGKAVYSVIFQDDCAVCSIRLSLLQADNGKLFGSINKLDAEGFFDTGSWFQVDLSGAQPAVQIFKQYTSAEADFVGLSKGAGGKLFGVARLIATLGSQAFTEIDVTSVVPLLKPAKVFGNLTSFLDQIQASDGNFYGVTLDGGEALYKLDTKATTELPQILHSFAQGSPQLNTRLVEGKDGALYGTNVKELYQLDITTPVPLFSVLFDLQKELNMSIDFVFNDEISFFRGIDGNVYGLTGFGGLYGTGALFRVKLDAPPANNPPVAKNDSYSLVYNKKGKVDTATVAAPGVLKNDSDAEGDALTVSGATATAPKVIQLPNGGGTVALYANGHFVYTSPKRRFFGTRSFTYQATDGKAAGNPATVTITLRKK